MFINYMHFWLSADMSLKGDIVVAKKMLHIIGAFVVKFFSRENVSDLVDQLIDALYERGVENKDV